MASPYITSQQPAPVERPWMGMAMLIAVPLLALILIRMLWSGSGLWFLTVGIILLGLAAVIFLAQRPQQRDYGGQTLAAEPNRLPLVLTGLAVVFLAMLLLPNFAGGDDGSPGLGASQSSGLTSDVAGSQDPAQPQVQQPQTQDPVAQDPAAGDPAGDAVTATGDTYIVADGDTLWDIATRFGTTVEAIVAANPQADPDNLQVGDELVIPPPDEAATGGAVDEAEPAAVE